MRRLLTWYANRRRADVILPHMLGWRLPGCTLVVIARDVECRCERRGMLVLSGAAVLNGRDYISWGSLRPIKGAVQFTLPEAHGYWGKRLWLQWMHPSEIVLNTQHHLWLLVFP